VTALGLAAAAPEAQALEVQVATAPAGGVEVQVAAGSAGVEAAADVAADAPAVSVGAQAAAPERPAVAAHAETPVLAQRTTPTAPLVRRVTGGDRATARAEATGTSVRVAASDEQVAPAAASTGGDAIPHDRATARETRPAGGTRVHERRDAGDFGARGDRVPAARDLMPAAMPRGCSPCGLAAPEALAQRPAVATTDNAAARAPRDAAPTAPMSFSAAPSAGAPSAGPSAGATAALAAAFAVLALLGCGRRLLSADAVRRRGPTLRPAARPG
jgi:hypothetical protein